MNVDNRLSMQPVDLAKFCGSLMKIFERFLKELFGNFWGSSLKNTSKKTL